MMISVYAYALDRPTLANIDRSSPYLPEHPLTDHPAVFRKKGL